MDRLAIDKAEEVVKKSIEKHNMHWNFESIDFVLNEENVSFDNLQNSDDKNLNLRLIIQCGIESHDKSEAFKIMDEIRECGVSPKMAHFVFVEVLKHKHFFSDTLERADIIQEGLARLGMILSQQNLLNNVSEKRN